MTEKLKEHEILTKQSNDGEILESARYQRNNQILERSKSARGTKKNNQITKKSESARYYNETIK